MSIRASAFTAFAFAFCLLSAAHAALIEIAVSGDATHSSGDIDYAPGCRFSAAFVFDTALTASPTGGPGVGLFSSSPGAPGGAGLVSAVVNTPFSPVSWAAEAASVVSPAGLFSRQLEFPSGAQSFTASVSRSAFAPDANGFAGGIDNNGERLSPFSITLEATTAQGTDAFFTDPKSLLSGAATRDLSALVIGRIIVGFTNGDDTTLAFGEPGDVFSIRVLDDVAEVPVPGALALMVTGLAGLGLMRRRKAGMRL